MHPAGEHRRYSKLCKLANVPANDSVGSLGRELISAQLNADGCELNEGQIVGRQLVISGRDAPFDQVGRGLKIGLLRLRFGGILAHAPCRAGKLPDPVRVVSAIRKPDNRHFRDFPLTGRTADMPKSPLMTVNGPFFDRVAVSA